MLSMTQTSFYSLAEGIETKAIRSRPEWTTVVVSCSLGHELLTAEARVDALRELMHRQPPEPPTPS